MEFLHCTSHACIDHCIIRLDHWKAFVDCCNVENRVLGPYSAVKYCAVFDTVDFGTVPATTSGIFRRQMLHPAKKVHDHQKYLTDAQGRGMDLIYWDHRAAS